MVFLLPEINLLEFLFIIPARGGSKSILKKNVKPLDGKPLISYTINFAQQFVQNEQICVSSDDPEILEIASSMGLNIPFIRPSEISGDHTGMMEVVRHAWSYYKSKNIYRGIVLLQPTSPFRRDIDFIKALNKYKNLKPELLFSAFEVKKNPYYLMFRETASGELENLIKNETYNCRQHAPKVLQANGAIYIMNSECIEKYDSFSQMQDRTVLKMPFVNSLDIDDIYDWYTAESYLSNQLVDPSNFEFTKNLVQRLKLNQEGV